MTTVPGSITLIRKDTDGDGFGDACDADYKPDALLKRESLDSLAKPASKGGSTNTEKEAIKGTVVAYDLGLELSDGSCRQTMIVRTKTGINQGKRNDFIIVRYEESCMKMIPERVLKPGPEWHFSLIRNVGCDLLLDELFYLHNMNETGGWVRETFMKVAGGGDADEIPKTMKFACYTLAAREFKPALKQQQITGVVIGLNGDPVRGAYVTLRYADSESDRMTVKD